MRYGEHTLVGGTALGRSNGVGGALYGTGSKANKQHARQMDKLSLNLES